MSSPWFTNRGNVQGFYLMQRVFHLIYIIGVWGRMALRSVKEKTVKKKGSMKHEDAKLPHIICPIDHPSIGQLIHLFLHLFWLITVKFKIGRLNYSLLEYEGLRICSRRRGIQSCLIYAPILEQKQLRVSGRKQWRELKWKQLCQQGHGLFSYINFTQVSSPTTQVDWRRLKLIMATRRVKLRTNFHMSSYRLEMPPASSRTHISQCF